jgi:hypothetical protein
VLIDRDLQGSDLLRRLLRGALGLQDLLLGLGEQLGRSLGRIRVLDLKFRYARALDQDSLNDLLLPVGAVRPCKHGLRDSVALAAKRLRVFHCSH